MLRNTVNSEALMTAFHQHQPGTNGNKVESVAPDGEHLAASSKSSHPSVCVCVCQSEEQVKEQLWEDHFSEFGRGVYMFRTEKTQRLVAMGIPESLRGELWMNLSGKIETDFVEISSQDSNESVG